MADAIFKVRMLTKFIASRSIQGISIGSALASVPLDQNFVIPQSNPNYLSNAAAALLAADGNTLISVQPLAHCTAGGPYTAWVRYPDSVLNGDGIVGAHGGSAMSSLGGALRAGNVERFS